MKYITEVSIIVITMVILKIFSVLTVANALFGISSLALIYFYLEAKKIKKSKYITSVKIYDGDNYLKVYVLPKKLVKIYNKEYNLPALEEKTYFVFLTKNLTPAEYFSYFLDVKTREDFLLSKISNPVTEEHSSQKNSIYHLSYYIGNVLNVTSTVNNRPLTKEDILNFTLFIQSQKGWAISSR